LLLHRKTKYNVSRTFCKWATAEDEIQELSRSDLLPLDFKLPKAGRGAKRSRVQALLRWKKRRENQLPREVLKKEDLKTVPFSFLVINWYCYWLCSSKFLFFWQSLQKLAASEPFAASAVGKQRVGGKTSKGF
jgi:hypothetical protein